MGTLQKDVQRTRNVKGNTPRHMYKSFGRSLLERWVGTPYISTPNPTVGDTSKSSGQSLDATKGYGYKSRRGKKRNNRCSSRRK